jgi:hypothetical protein
MVVYEARQRKDDVKTRKKSLNDRLESTVII